MTQYRYHHFDHHHHHIHHHYHQHYHHNHQDNSHDAAFTPANSTDSVDLMSFDPVEPKSTGQHHCKATNLVDPNCIDPVVPKPTNQDDCKATNPVDPDCIDPEKPEYTEQADCKSANLVDPECTDWVKSKPTDAVGSNSADQVNSSPPVTAPHDATVNGTECKQEDQAEVLLQQNAKKDPEPENTMRDVGAIMCLLLIFILVMMFLPLFIGASIEVYYQHGREAY